MPNNDLISRAAIIKEIERIRKSTKTLTGIDFLWMIETFPAVDAAPVVRCKDYRCYNTNFCGDGFGWCERNGVGHSASDDWFCVDGEK